MRTGLAHDRRNGQVVWRMSLSEAALLADALERDDPDLWPEIEQLRAAWRRDLDERSAG